MSKLCKKLSPAVLEGLQPEAAPYRAWDTVVPQLHVRVQPTGIKSFNVQWSRTKTLSLGKWPAVTVEGARTRARAVLAEVETHGAPVAVMEAKRPGAKLKSLRDFIDRAWRPWAVEHLKWGAGAADRILSAFADLADRPLKELNAWAVEQWRARRLKAGIAKSTCNREIASLKAAINDGREWGLIPGDPLAPVRQSRVEADHVRYLTPDESRLLRAALVDRDAEAREARARANAWRRERGKETLPELAPGDFADHLHPAVLVSLNTGLRRGELTALTWEDVNLGGARLTVRAAAAKSGRTRHLPLNAEALTALSRWKTQGAGAGRVFPVADVKTAWRSLLERAGVANLRWHDLRHDFASRLVMAGVDLNTVRELLGHADLKMTLRYAHLAPAKLADAVKRLEVAA